MFSAVRGASLLACLLICVLLMPCNAGNSLTLFQSTDLIGVLANGTVFCVGVEEGDIQWSFGTGSVPMKATAMDDNILIPSLDGGLYIRLGDGRVKRIAQSVEELVARSPFLTLSGDVVLFGNRSAHAWQFNSRDGQYERLHGSTEAVEVAGDASRKEFADLLLTLTDFHVNAVDVQSRSSMWTANLGQFGLYSFATGASLPCPDHMCHRLTITTLGAVTFHDYDRRPLWTQELGSPILSVWFVNRGTKQVFSGPSLAMDVGGSKATVLHLAYVDDTLLAFPLDPKLAPPPIIGSEEGTHYLVDDLGFMPTVPALTSPTDTTNPLDPTVIQPVTPKPTDPDRMSSVVSSVVSVVIATGISTALLVCLNRSKNPDEIDNENGVESSSNEPTLSEDGILHIEMLTVDTKQVLGYGSVGTVVFKGSFGGRPVAVKRLLKSSPLDTSRREIDALIAVDEHRNIVRYYCAVETKDFLFVALELCRMSLSELIIEDESINPTEIVHDIASGLEHLHQMGIAHRDIKPQNILIGMDGVAKISDMGFARWAPAAQSFKSVGASGSTGWQPPEVLQGGRLTRNVDLFSMGVVAHYVFSHGHHCFGSEQFSRDANIVNGKLTIHPSLTVLARDYVRSLVLPDPDARMAACAAVHHPVFWDSNRKLTFLADFSDRIECLDVEDPIVLRFEQLCDEIDVIPLFGWQEALGEELETELARWRKYRENSARDLLRFIRNKRSHFRDMSPELQQLLGPVPDGYYSFYEQKFPNLFSVCYFYARTQFSSEYAFEQYFPWIEERTQTLVSSVGTSQQRSR